MTSERQYRETIAELIEMLKITQQPFDAMVERIGGEISDVSIYGKSLSRSITRAIGHANLVLGEQE